MFDISLRVTPRHLVCSYLADRTSGASAVSGLAAGVVGDLAETHGRRWNLFSEQGELD